MTDFCDDGYEDSIIGALKREQDQLAENYRAPSDVYYGSYRDLKDQEEAQGVAK